MARGRRRSWRRWTTYRKLGGIPVNGPYAASVPGAVAGFDLAWKKYGSLKYATLLQAGHHGRGGGTRH